MRLDENDPRITAYALGEMEEVEREAFERELQGDAEAQAHIEAIRQTASLLSKELTEEGVPGLSSEQQAAVVANLRQASGASATPRNIVSFRIPLLARRTWHLLASNLAATILVVSAASIPILWTLFLDNGPGVHTTAKTVGQDGSAPNRGRAGEPGPSVTLLVPRNVPEEEHKEQEKLQSLGYLDGGVARGVAGGVVGGEISASEERTRERLDDSDQSLDALRYQTGPFNTESYDRIDENPFLSVSRNPLSTFSIDVDTASYSNVRRFLNECRLPPKDAIRIEELVNYFKYDYPDPAGSDPFAVAVDVASAPWAPSHRLVRIGLKGREVPAAERRACNLVFLIDVSGSMEPANKLPLLKRALSLMVDKLTQRDRVAIVVYAGASGLALPSTSCQSKEAIHGALEGLESGGSTNGASGIQLAYEVASQHYAKDGINRVILATDGDFNVGITDQGELTRLIEQEAKRGIFLSVLGFGMDNYKDSTLEKLADRGNGNYAYIDTMAEAHKVLLEQLDGTLITIAKDVKIQVEFNPRQVASYRLIGYENRALRAEDFNDDKKDAGEIGAGHTVTALYELIPPGQNSSAGGVDPLRYQAASGLTGAAEGGELLTVKLRYKEPEGSSSKLIEHPVRDEGKSFEQADGDFRFAASVAAFGMVLRESPHKGSATLDAISKWAIESVEEDVDGYRAGFIELLGKAIKLKNC